MDYGLSTPTLYSLGKKRACEWRSLRSATGTLIQNCVLCIAFCNARWGIIAKKQKKQVKPAFAGWNEWTRTTDPHLIRVVL